MCFSCSLLLVVTLFASRPIAERRKRSTRRASASSSRSAVLSFSSRPHLDSARRLTQKAAGSPPRSPLASILGTRTSHLVAPHSPPATPGTPPVLSDDMKEHGLSLGLSTFFKHEPLPPNVFSPDRTSSSASSQNPFEALSIHEHIPHIPSPALCTPPLSPADSYISLYPLPPHLTPQSSPTVSRSSSPTWPEHDHENVSTHLLEIGRSVV